VDRSHDTSFPPPGWVTSGQVARMLGISAGTLKSGGSRWRIPGGKGVRRPEGGRCKIYPIEQVEQFKAQRTVADAARPEIPEGFVDREGARRMFGVTARQWQHWIGRGVVSCGVIIPDRRKGGGGKCAIYPIEALKKLREELFSRDVLYNYAKGNFVVPDGWSRRHEACQMLAVDRATWDGWERDGLLPCGRRFDDGPMLYEIEQLKRMLHRVGRLAPPEPDASGGGAIRVPLYGRGTDGRWADGRVAIIDAEALPLLDGKILTWGGGNGGEGTFVALCSADKPRGVALRRVILGMMDKDRQVGHVNGDPMDCRRVNLFERSIAQRVQGNQKIRERRGQPCSSRFKGVCWETQTKSWRAKIEIDGKRHSLGRFGDEIAAAQAYDEAARQAWGEYAWLNFPHGVDAWLEAQRADRAEAA
jgi:hypothetical protein